MTWNIINGNSAEILKTYPDNTFDCVVTDPPYGINFLGKSWDHNTGDRGVYEQCLRVLKPGGHLLAFSAARTYHHLAMTVETVGFEIRDQIMWIYGSGFPKSQDVGRQIDKKAGIKHDYVDYHNNQTDTRNVNNNANAKNRHCKKCNKQLGTSNLKCDENPCVIKNPPIQSEWAGWGSQLKPAHEPIVMARKPMKNSIRENVQTYGTGAINIDATRVPTDAPLCGSGKKNEDGTYTRHTGKGFGQGMMPAVEYNPNQGRFPANVIHDGSDEVVNLFPDSNGSGGSIPNTTVTGYGKLGGGKTTYTPNDRKEHDSGSGSAARFFYCPKVSSKERHIGYDVSSVPQIGDTHPDKIKQHPLWDPSIGGDAARLKQKIIDAGAYKGNNHPTVKPIELMKYLIKLVTPPNGHVLDPFNGSGSTGCAAVELGFDYTGIELDPKYVEIATKRISYWENECKPKTTYNQLFEEK